MVLYLEGLGWFVVWMFCLARTKNLQIVSLLVLNCPVCYLAPESSCLISVDSLCSLLSPKIWKRWQFLAWISINLRIVEVQAALEDRANDALSDPFQSPQRNPSMSQKNTRVHFWVCKHEVDIDVISLILIDLGDPSISNCYSVKGPTNNPLTILGTSCVEVLQKSEKPFLKLRLHRIFACFWMGFEENKRTKR